jgi:transcriptional regulator with XRE-family HTH domain
MAKETLGERLQRLRQEAGLTQEQLAANASLSIHNIRNWEHDHRVPGLAAVYHLSRALGVPMEELAVCVVKQRK